MGSIQFHVKFKTIEISTHYLDKASNISECTSKVCHYGRGDYAYLLDEGCFAVTCDTDHSQCNPRSLPGSTPTSLPGSSSAAARIYWTGTKANEMLQLKCRPESSLLRVKVKRQFSTIAPVVLHQTWKTVPSCSPGIAHSVKRERDRVSQNCPCYPPCIRNNSIEVGRILG